MYRLILGAADDIDFLHLSSRGRDGGGWRLRVARSTRQRWCGGDSASVRPARRRTTDVSPRESQPGGEENGDAAEKKRPGIIKAENGHLFNPLIFFFFLFAVGELKDCAKKKKTSAKV